MANSLASEIWFDAFAFLPRLIIEQRVKRVNRKFLRCVNAMRNNPFLWYTNLTVILIGVEPPTIAIKLEDFGVSLRKASMTFCGETLKTLQIPSYLKVNNVTIYMCDASSVGASCVERAAVPDDVLTLLERMRKAWCRKASPDRRKCNRMEIFVNDKSALERVLPLISAYIAHIRLFTITKWPIEDFYRLEGIRHCMQLTVEADVCDFDCIPAAQIAEWLSQASRLCAANYGRTLRLIALNGRLSTPYYAKYEEICRILVETFSKAEEPATFTLSIQAPAYVTDMSAHTKTISHTNSRTREILAGKLRPNQLSLKRCAQDADDAPIQ